MNAALCMARPPCDPSHWAVPVLHPLRGCMTAMLGWGLAACVGNSAKACPDTCSATTAAGGEVTAVKLSYDQQLVAYGLACGPEQQACVVRNLQTGETGPSMGGVSSYGQLLQVVASGQGWGRGMNTVQLRSSSRLSTSVGQFGGARG